MSDVVLTYESLTEKIAAYNVINMELTRLGRLVAENCRHLYRAAFSDYHVRKDFIEFIVGEYHRDYGWDTLSTIRVPYDKLADDAALKAYVVEYSTRRAAALKRLERINEASAAARKEAQERENYERLKKIYGGN